MIQIQQLHKAYGTQIALRNLSLHIPKGCIFGLLGANGAGKTTLISILAGILPKTSGKIMVDGIDLDAEPAALQAYLGLVPQHLAFYPQLSVQENLDFYAGALGLSGAGKNERISDTIAFAKLEAYRQQRAGQLSGGLQRRLNLAIGLLNAPRLLILDEPTVGIDPQSRHLILQSLLRLRDQGVTILYTSHYMDEVQQICDELAIIDKGRILMDGSMRVLLQDAGADLLNIELERPLSELQRHALERMLSVPVRMDGSFTSLSLRGSLESLELLIAFARSQQLGVRSIRFGAQDLEQVFLRLTSPATAE